MPEPLTLGGISTYTVQPLGGCCGVYYNTSCVGALMSIGLVEHGKR